MLPEKENIAIAELVVYIPFLLAALFVAFKHGLKRGVGFLYLVIFCSLRIAGAILSIISVHNPHNGTDIAWAAIIGSIGLSPLLLASFGLLNRVYGTPSLGHEKQLLMHLSTGTSSSTAAN